jgi:hypothetical protein
MQESFRLASCDNSDCPLFHFEGFSAICRVSSEYYSTFILAMKIQDANGITAPIA